MAGRVPAVPEGFFGNGGKRLEIVGFEKDFGKMPQIRGAPADRRLGLAAGAQQGVKQPAPFENRYDHGV